MATVLYESSTAPGVAASKIHLQESGSTALGQHSSRASSSNTSVTLESTKHRSPLKHGVSSSALDRYERTVSIGTRRLDTTEEKPVYERWDGNSDVDTAAEDNGYVNWITPNATPSRQEKRNSARQDVMWSDEFHDLLVALSKANARPEEEEILFESLRKLELDFVYTAETWGRVIIEELFLPDDKKTIKPLQGDGAGFLGGYKYEVRGVFFKFAHEIHNLVSSNDAAKLSGHEMRACSAVALYALESADFTLLPPLMALVDFRGYRLLAVSQLPVKGSETLVYGSNDGGKTIRNSDPRFKQAIERLGDHFNLAKHFSGADDATELFTGTDVEGHHDPVRDRYYLLDLSRLFPPEAPSPISPEQDQAFLERATCAENCKCQPWRAKQEARLERSKTEGAPSAGGAVVTNSGSEVMDAVGVSNNPRLYKQLRPFFLQQEGCPPLCSDAFSRFQSPRDADVANSHVEQQTARLKSVLVHRACVYLEHREADSELYPANFSFSHFLHERGLNIRLLGLIYVRINPKSKWSRICLIEMVARVFKSFVRSRFRSLARRKGDSVIRNGGVVKDGVRRGNSISVFRASAEDFHEEATLLLSLLVMNVDTVNAGRSDTKAKEDEESRLASFAFWDALILLMKQKFGLSEAYERLNDKGEAANPRFLCPLRLPEMLKPNVRQLLERACTALGFQVASQRVFTQPVTPEAPLPADALQDLKPLVKHLNLIHVAEAKVFHHRALRERNQRACEMLRKARLRLENVLREAPPVSSPFLLDTLGEILFALAIRIQPERMEFELTDEALRNLMKAEGAFREIAARSTFEKRDELARMYEADLSPQFISKASAHPLVLKTQQAKRYANVVSSIIMNDLPNAKGVLRLRDIVMAVGKKQFRLWDTKKKLLIWTYECDEELASWTAIPGGEVAVFIGVHGTKMHLVDMSNSSVSELDMTDVTASPRQRPPPEQPFVVGLAALSDGAGATLLIHARADGNVTISRLVRRKRDAQLDAIKRFLVNQLEGRVVGIKAVERSGLVAIADLKRVHLFNRELVPIGSLHANVSPIITSMDISLDNNFVAAGLHDGSILVWSLEKALGGAEKLDEQHPTLLHGHLGKTTCVSFAGSNWPNQDTLFSGSADRTVRIWNVRLAICVRVLAGHLDSVQSLHFDEDDKLLVTAAMDSRVRLWRFDQVPFLPINSPDLPEQQSLLQNAMANQASTATALGGETTEQEKPKPVTPGRRRHSSFAKMLGLTTCLGAAT